MTEIKIEKKKNNWVQWLMAIIGFVLLAWLAVDLIDKDGEPELFTPDEINFPDADLSSEGVDLDEVNAQVFDEVAVVTADAEAELEEEAFDENWDGEDANYTDNYRYLLTSINLMGEDMNVHHDYSNIALRGLANSLKVLAEDTNMSKQVEIKDKCKLIKTQAAAITRDWKSTDHADKIKKAALAAVEVLQEIQEEKFPELSEEVTEVQKAASAINPDEVLLNQKEAVKNFFDTAVIVLALMKSV